MKRLKGIDIFRGIIMLAMVFVHLRDWWIIGGATATFSNITRPFIDRTFAPAFMFLGLGIIGLLGALSEKGKL